MLDKLHLRSHSIIPDKTVQEITMGGHLSSHGILDKNYRSCLIIKKEGCHILTIKRLPNLPNNWSTYLELNPSKFGSFKEMVNFLGQLKINPCDAEIRRIDHCSDMDISLEEVRTSLIVKGKRKRTDYEDKDKLTGFYFGKGQEVIAVYDKKAESEIKNAKINSCYKNLTRFEVRQKGKAILHNKIIDLDKYLQYDPYSKLKFYTVLTEEVEQGDLPVRDKVFLHMLNDRGLHSTYKNFNAHSNFKRDFQKKVIDSCLSANITAKYHQKLNSFLKG